MVTHEEELTEAEFEERSDWLCDHAREEWDYQILNDDGGHWETYEFELSDIDHIAYKLRWL